MRFTVLLLYYSITVISTVIISIYITSYHIWLWVCVARRVSKKCSIYTSFSIYLHPQGSLWFLWTTVFVPVYMHRSIINTLLKSCPSLYD